MLQAARNAAYFESDKEMMNILSSRVLSEEEKDAALIKAYEMKSKASNKRLENFEASIKSGGRRHKTHRRKSHRRKSHRRKMSITKRRR
jgi:hypothetical protein